MKETRQTRNDVPWTPLERRLGMRIRHAPIGQCLTFEQFLDLARRGRRTLGYHDQMLHVVSCPACRRALLETRILLRTRRSALSRWLSQLALPRLPQWALASGVAASLFVLAVWTLYPRTSNPDLIATSPTPAKRTTVAHAPPNPPANAKAPSPTTPEPPSSSSGSTGGKVSTTKSAPSGKKSPASGDTGAKPSDDRAGGRSEPSGEGSQTRLLAQQTPPESAKPSAADNAPAPQTQVAQNTPATEPSRPEQSALQRELASAPAQLAARASELHGLLASLLRRAGTRGGGGANIEGAIRFTQPDLRTSDLLEETTPRFEWTPVNNAQEYTLLLRSENGQVVLETTLPAQQNTYQVSQPLTRGVSYTLELKAQRGIARTLTGTVRFRVMSEAEIAELRLAREIADSNPMLSAMLFVKLERYAEARTAIERALQRYPDDEQVQQLANIIRARLR